MGARVVHQAVLRRCLLALALVAVLLESSPASAHNVYEGGYRKFPWKAGETGYINTLPGECPHCPGVQSSSAWKALDISDMDYETVYAVTPGTIDAYDPGGGAAGMYLRILSTDGTYITYEHLSKALVTSGFVFAGEPIAVSGCTGNCNGAHLHFQRQSGPSFSSNALNLVPISGHGGSGDPLEHAGYTGDNAGIGSTSAGGISQTMQAAYRAAGNYKTFGTTGSIGDAWMPCRNDSIYGTWWRYTCSPRSGTAGSVQTYLGPGEKKRALMHPSGDDHSYVLHQGILGAYTEFYGGHDWVYWIGYPTGNRYAIQNGTKWRQMFQRGRIDYSPETCRSSIYIGTDLRAEETFCD